ncbi:MAG TPA: tRNA epoxyqueuosine(34) reductase QueG, partial [Thermoanaerobaculia bacterium]|nr:tRNA epoxyqueuosine(34) reductase QueG [Thermoanaerobaculia bacterium]
MITKLSEVWPALEQVALSEGVLRFGAASLSDAHASLFASWIERGHHATMSYLARNLPTRLDPSSRFPWALSAVVILVPYSADRPPAPPGALSHHVARYALGDDYHQVLDRILRAFESALPPEVRTWRYVDTGPLSDRALAANAGLGWIAKNGMLISEEDGSYTFIGALLTSLESDIHAELAADRCGTCTRCLDACPTAAILPDRTLDSARCISYATIEHRGPLEVAPHGHVFGCDICQEVCPWNHPPAPPTHPAFTPRPTYGATPVTDLLRLTQSDFSTLFRKSAIKRTKLAGLL